MAFFFKEYQRPARFGKRMPLVDVRRFNGLMLRALQLRAIAIMKDYERVVKTWNHDVKFQMDVRYSGGQARIHVFTADRIFRYVDRGTVNRYAVMTNNFMPKTYPGVLASGPGQGGLAFVRRKSAGPQASHPGIKARNFTITIRMKHDPLFKSDVSRVIAKTIFGRRP